MEKDAIKLLKKYTEGTCNAEEKALVEQWYNQLPLDGNTPSIDAIERTQQRVWQNINPKKSTGKYILLKRVSIAASILLCLSIGMYLVLSKKESLFVAKKELKDIQPGGNKALLTLADGSVINLDEAAKGQIADQNGIIIRKAENGQIEYIVKDGSDVSKIGSNTISTPRGGQYQVNLPDGTKVWLNAASSLKYPYVFTSNERLVELNGEAYFEVSKDKTRPFRIKTALQTVEVLGTHFNVNAYTDENAVKTTLLEGSVKVNSILASVKLVPGEQSILTAQDDKLSINKEVDVDKELAWKNNLFSFDNDDLKTIMRQISRWYDVDVVYSGKISDEKYVGDIPRNSNLSEVFKILELNHIRVDASGKVVTISGN
ncbi:FecR family protein [Pedobacter sp. MW01-1-1]|uniref:FecR family protein n=1 Tax=Pedobacter sp. MW01-1-1 TaxID=3383027 RepID=UPI003FEE5C3F